MASPVYGLGADQIERSGDRPGQGRCQTPVDGTGVVQPGAGRMSGRKEAGSGETGGAENGLLVLKPWFLPYEMIGGHEKGR